MKLSDVQQGFRKQGSYCFVYVHNDEFVSVL